MPYFISMVVVFTDEVLKAQGYNEDDNFNIVATCAPVMKEGDTPEIGYPTSELVKEQMGIAATTKDLDHRRAVT
jgi:putative aldouronate transport system substrate-binding protein